MTRRNWLRSSGAAAAAIVTAISGGMFARCTARRSRLTELARSVAGDHQHCAITFNLFERPIALEEAAQRYDRAFASFTTLTAQRACLADWLINTNDGKFATERRTFCPDRTGQAPICRRLAGGRLVFAPVILPSPPAPFHNGSQTASKRRGNKSTPPIDMTMGLARAPQAEEGEHQHERPLVLAGHRQGRGNCSGRRDRQFRFTDGFAV
jgi:hypothetical protein